MSDTNLTIVGAGRIGNSVAVALARSTLFPVIQVVGRRPELPDVAGGISTLRYHGTREPERLLIAEPSLSRSGALLFCVPDDAIESVAARWANALGASGPRPRVALHTSGLHPGEVLARLRATGAALGSWHPLLALAEPRADAFRGVTFALEGEPDAVELGERLTEAVGGRTLPIAADQKPRYHAAAVFGSNYLVACLNVARRLLEESCSQGDLEDLLPLARSALDSLDRAGIQKGATGPILRGDVGTIRRHLEALDPTTGALYRALAMELLTLSSSRLDREVRDEVRGVLAAEASTP